MRRNPLICAQPSTHACAVIWECNVARSTRHPVRSGLKGVLVTSDDTNLLHGTLELMILTALAFERMHRLGILGRIKQITEGMLQMKSRSLFSALQRMEEAGLLESLWGESENSRRTKYYRLTKAGRCRLESEARRWRRVSWAIARALQTL